jgi:hypothetical protein
MASPYSFHERGRAVSDMAPDFFRGPPYVRSPLAVSFDSMVKMAS